MSYGGGGYESYGNGYGGGRGGGGYGGGRESGHSNGYVELEVLPVVWNFREIYVLCIEHCASALRGVVSSASASSLVTAPSTKRLDPLDLNIPNLMPFRYTLCNSLTSCRYSTNGYSNGTSYGSSNGYGGGSYGGGAGGGDKMSNLGANLKTQNWGL